VQTKKPTSLCIPATSDFKIMFEGDLIVGQGANATTKQIKNGPVSLFFPQSINMNPSSKFSYVVGIWDIDNEDTSTIFLNTAYQFGSGACDLAAGFAKGKLYDWDTTPAFWDAQFGKKETHRFIALAWKAKDDQLDGTKFSDRKNRQWFDKDGGRRHFTHFIDPGRRDLVHRVQSVS